METLEQIKARIAAAIPEVRLEIVPNGAVAEQPSLRVDSLHAVAVAQWLREDPLLRLDYASNVTGVDWPDRVVLGKVTTTRLVGGVERPVQEQVETRVPGYLEVVYHLYSMARKHGPLILRQRTEDRREQVRVASLTPVWRGAEFQEREVYDLYGVRFDGHPDLRRILMWDGFKDFPMRRDYIEPDDYEYEPTPHGAVLDRTRTHYPGTEA